MGPNVIISTKDYTFVDELSSLFIKRNLVITVCNSQVSSILKILDQKIDFLILDFEKPDQTSLDFISIIKKTRPNLPIIVFAENPSIELVIELYNLGIFYWSLKPVSEQETNMIIDAIESIKSKQNALVNNN
ncbi:response regulator [candidate division KSB1 bacterium]|nr:response regulator [candidate division KSB1 bacterium]